MTLENIPALNKGAIYSKSKVYILRALRSKSHNNIEEYQLWASLALELLGKSALAAKHPSLIVDPNHAVSLFAANGISIGTDIKTIAWHTLFERLRHLSRNFDNTVKEFCDSMAQRRNAELHSGEVPFQAMKLDAWEGKYWHAAQIILEMLDSTLDEWLGADQAKAPKEIVSHAIEARISAAHIKVDQAKRNFQSKKKKEQELALSEAEIKYAFHYRQLFKICADAEWDVRCPACTGKAFLAGVKYHEEVVMGSYDTDSSEELVEKYFSAEEFRCPVCDLHLCSQDEIKALGIDPEHIMEDVREREYEAEYGND